MKFISILIIFLALVCIALILYITPYEMKKSRWDEKITELCLKEGGVEVFEHVVLSQEEYDKNDGRGDYIIITDKYNAKAEFDYIVESEHVVMNKVNPEVIKSISTTFRKNDDKVMQIWTTFFRRGGDVPSLAHPSSFSCSRVEALKPKYRKKFYSLAQGIVKHEK